MNDLVEELSKTKRLEYLLLQEIKEKYPQPHELFYSEREIIEKYGLNRTTVRQALKALTEKGYLYRVNGKGTFTAPPAKRKQILIVQKVRENPFETGSYAQIEFNNGISRMIQQEDLPFVAIQIDIEYYLEILSEIQLIYKNLSGIIFYSDVEPLFKTKQVLEKIHIPFLFFGSDQSLEKKSVNYFVYNQHDITTLALDYLYSQGHTGIGLVSMSGSTIRSQRKQEYLQWMERHHLAVPEDFIIDLSFHMGKKRDVKYGELKDQLKQLFPVPHLTAVLCVDDLIALYFINTVIRLGMDIPGDLSIIGINDYPFCPDIIVPLTTVQIPFYESGKECITRFTTSFLSPEPVQKECPLRLVERESVQKA